MAALPGTGLSLVLVDDGSIFLGGIRNIALKGSASVVDVTHRDSAGGWRELLGSCGRLSYQITCQMVFIEDAAQSQLQADFENRTLKRYNFRVVPGGFTWRANMRVTELELAGDYEDAVMYNVTFESADAPIFTDL